MGVDVLLVIRCQGMLYKEPQGGRGSRDFRLAQPSGTTG
jgi:hypothetical protein